MFLKNNTAPADQTVFSNEEPLYEAVSLPADPALQTEVKKSGLTRPHLLIIILSVVSILVLVIGFLIVLLNRPTARRVVEPSPTAEPMEADAFLLEIRALQNTIRQADPGVDAQPLPPVDLEFRLEK